MPLPTFELTYKLNEISSRLFSISFNNTTDIQAYKVVCTYIKELLAKKQTEFYNSQIKKEKKQVYYMSMEFLVGTSLKNNLFNLGVEKLFFKVLSENGKNLNDLYALDPDAGLGNGGLGRLACCYMDSLTTQNFVATGFSIRYAFGIFKQKIIDGWQMEFPDNWLDKGEVWLRPREDDAVYVSFGGETEEWYENGHFKTKLKNCKTVKAIPYDMFITGYNTKAVNKLVLWSAVVPDFDMSAFSRGDYLRSLEQNTMAEVISKVLYPADDHTEGKRLRLKQQYLLCSASLQSIVNFHLKKYKTLSNIEEKIAIHINDTHPALCVPELMRIFMDEHDLSWDEAFLKCSKILTYTNHTVMSEALEKWSVELFKTELPRIYKITEEINRRLVKYLSDIYPNDYKKIDYMSVISDGYVKMYNLCLSCCHKINGVSALHTKILTEGIFKDYYNIDNARFLNVTNGIAYRRWLCQANPNLSNYLLKLLGPGFLTDCNALSELKNHKNNKTVLTDLYTIKQQNKAALAKYISQNNGIKVDINSVFDVQIKRLHEYKRQLLNVLHILYLYIRLKEDKNFHITPKTFIFGAKASAGYIMAKQIISLINSAAELINNSPVTKDLIKVVFLEDYRVSLAEKIIPAADISEQISLAGKEASGTGNMKLMINGAVTLGTLDGANVEILKCVGKNNIYIFGNTEKQVEEILSSGYNVFNYINKNPYLKQVLNMLVSGELNKRFPDILDSLTTNKYGIADRFLNLADFDSYVLAQEEISRAYENKEKFGRMSLMNIANAGLFSADRSVLEYAFNIWDLKR